MLRRADASRAAETLTAHEADGLAGANLAHNALALGADLALFLVGLSFASSSTVLPAFAAHLGAPNVVIGAIPAIMVTGWFLPSLFAAGHTETLPRRLPFILRYTLWERVPFVGLGLAAFLLAERAPAVALGAVLGLLIVIASVGGLLMPAWMDVIGRTIPTSLRGRFFAFSSAVGAAGGLLGGFATSAILDAVPAPRGYGICFLVAAFFMGLSYAALALVREPVVVTTAPPRTLGVYLRRVPALLRRDPSFSWFLVARTASIIGAAAIPFYAVHGLRGYGATDRWVGIFTAVLFSGQVLGTVTFGWLADHLGHRIVIVLGVTATAAASGLALLAPDLGVFSAVFGFSGLQQAAATVSNLNVLMEFAPEETERPTYVGLGNTLVAPVAFVAPLAAGAVADAWGFHTVFLTSIAFSGVGLALLLARVRDPRHTQAG